MTIGSKRYHELSDKELVSRLKQDDVKAFKELYNRYWNKLLLQAKIKLNSEADSEEIVQNVFIGLWKRRKNLLLKYTFHTYIASCVKYEIFSHYAKLEKNRKFVVDDIEELYKLSVNTTEEWLSYDSVHSIIEETVAKLPEKCKLVFRMSREEGLSHKEIANELNISTKTVEAHITKALRIISQSTDNLSVLSFIIWEYYEMTVEVVNVY